jgi:predicted ATPase
VPGGEPKYIFKHILTQEVAYESLLFSRRRELHKKIAEYYELNFEDNLESYYELLAFHYPRSEELPRALNYAVLAGDKAKKTYANHEAIRYYDLALEVFDKMKELGYKLEDEPESKVVQTCHS